MSPYDKKPQRFLLELLADFTGEIRQAIYCAGFEVKIWRCHQFADHLIDWIADYALSEDELTVDHTNMFIRLREAASRVYRSDNYKKRGEVGEIVLHGICRDFFGTIPFAPRVFYLTSSNDVVKGFDLVHFRYLEANLELWLGEAKFYENGVDAIKSAIASVEAHIDQGFLNNEKVLLGPQVSKSLPQYREIRDLLSVQTSLDKLFETAVFPVCIACDSAATGASVTVNAAYVGAIEAELQALLGLLRKSKLQQKIRVMLIYVPLGSKAALADAFDARLRGFAR